MDAWNSTFIGVRGPTQGSGGASLQSATETLVDFQRESAAIGQTSAAPFHPANSGFDKVFTRCGVYFLN
ncbi:MAG TPA: hypothetical protein VG056_17115 [Pirellulales bacterium]|jgi:hypothetical protein|nr:hypothetical protein [Pirellulales bacterium]